MRFAVNRFKHDGYNKSGTNDADTTSLRAQYLIKPSDKVSVRFGVDYTKLGGVGNVDVASGEGELSFREPVPLVYGTSVLHANPHAWWAWYSDVYAGGLLVLSITAVIMVRGRNGLFGFGGALIVAGFLVPFLIYRLVVP